MVAPDRTGSEVASQASLFIAARDGDRRAFERLTSPHARALHVHCYRMLGSFHDADDALQETLLRAWRGLGGYEPRGPLDAWLYRIATNVCLTAIARRARPEQQRDDDEVLHLQPYPDRLLDELPSGQPDPEARIEERESVELAFVTAMQLLPPKQRAVLVLRDVLGWSAREVADQLGDSVAAVNSALQRARSRLERERREGRLARIHAPLGDAAERTVMRRFLEAWEAVDVDRIVALLSDDALLTMPPEPMRLVGRETIGGFFATVPAGGRLERIRLVPTRANRQPALAAYLQDDEGVFKAYGVMVFAVDGEAITGITGFAGYPDLVPEFGLPPLLEEG